MEPMADQFHGERDVKLAAACTEARIGVTDTHVFDLICLCNPQRVSGKLVEMTSDSNHIHVEAEGMLDQRLC